jgi:hypothetical protein
MQKSMLIIKRYKSKKQTLKNAANAKNQKATQQNRSPQIQNASATKTKNSRFQSRLSIPN